MKAKSIQSIFLTLLPRHKFSKCDRAPQSWKGREKEYEQCIKDLSSNICTFMLPPCHTNSISLKGSRTKKMKRMDPRLKTLKSMLVPSTVSEEEFWKSYLFFVDVVKDSTHQNVTSRVGQYHDIARDHRGIPSEENKTTTDVEQSPTGEQQSSQEEQSIDIDAVYVSEEHDDEDTESEEEEEFSRVVQVLKKIRYKSISELDPTELVDPPPSPIKPPSNVRPARRSRRQILQSENAVNI